MGVLYAYAEITCVRIGSGSKTLGCRSTTIWKPSNCIGVTKTEKFPAEFLCLKTMLLRMQREAITALVPASSRCMLNVVGDYTFAEMAVVYNMCGVHREI